MQTYSDATKWAQRFQPPTISGRWFPTNTDYCWTVATIGELASEDGAGGGLTVTDYYERPCAILLQSLQIKCGLGCLWFAFCIAMLTPAPLNESKPLLTYDFRQSPESSD